MSIEDRFDRTATVKRHTLGEDDGYGRRTTSTTTTDIVTGWKYMRFDASTFTQEQIKSSLGLEKNANVQRVTGETNDDIQLGDKLHEDSGSDVFKILGHASQNGSASLNHHLSMIVLLEKA